MHRLESLNNGLGISHHACRRLERERGEAHFCGEWLAVVAEDPELHIDEDNGPYFAVWSGPCTDPDGRWFDWADGCISTKNPDPAILGKMLRWRRS
jgi:hypothetical protein